MSKLPSIPKPGLLDRAIGAIAPARAVKRMYARWHYSALTGGYKGGRKDRRPTSGWKTQDTSADAASLPDLTALRARSHDLVRNNPLAAGALQTKVTSIVGSGLRVKAEVDGDFIGLSEADKEETEAALEREFNRWADSCEGDISRRRNFTETQDLVLRSVLEAGDICALKRFKERPGSPFGFKLQLIEAGRLSNPKWTRDSKTQAGGVELDSDGAPKAYHFSAPNEPLKGSRPTDWVRVEAFAADGSPNVLHLYRQRRPDQTRGIPDFAAVIEPLKQLGDYTDGELQAAVISSFFTVFVKSETGEGLDEMEPTAETGGAASDDDYKMAAGAILDLKPGEEISTANPGRPNDSFDPFVLAILRQVGVSLELPYEILIKHFTASYSAARAALLEAWKYYRRERHWLASKFCQPVYEAVITEAVARGRITLPGFLANADLRRAYLAAQWHGDAMPSIDPKKENEADALAEDRNWKTGAQNTSEKFGGDFDRNVARRKKEVAAVKAAGLPVKASAPVPVGSDDPPDKAEGGPDTESEDES
jgi:lambda family phage portal protein